VPELANQTGSEQVSRGAPAQKRSALPWRPASLWLWPAAALGLAGAAAALFGAEGALIVGGVALAALVFFAGILTLDRDSWLAVSLAAALIASLAVFVGKVWLKESHHKGGKPAAMATMAPGQRATATPRAIPAPGATSMPATALTPQASWTPPANWPFQRVSQAMAQRANFRGADLNGANLAGLQLSHKNFDGVQANGASFRGSQLMHTSFRGASLRDACLEGVNLTGADLTGADLTGADVAGVTVSRRATRSALVWPRRRAKPAAACQ
jgi:Pentapeptide repeats (8 copies)